ncbi:hypothetical protein D3C84_1067850 [compost metagenome]
MENCGYVAGLLQPYFSFVSQFVITELLFISEPVAASVSTEPIGRASTAVTLLVIISHTSPSYFTPAAIAFAQSSTLPPPTAKIN